MRKKKKDISLNVDPLQWHFKGPRVQFIIFFFLYLEFYFSNDMFTLFFLILFLTLQYCIGFAIYQHESATGTYMLPILNPPPSSLPVPSLWVVPVHQPQASSIVHRTWTGDSFHI